MTATDGPLPTLGGEIPTDSFQSGLSRGDTAYHLQTATTELGSSSITRSLETIPSKLFPRVEIKKL